MSKNLAELRDLLEKVFEEVASQEGKTATPDIIGAVRLKHPEAVRRCSTELENIALTKLIDEVSRRVDNPFLTHPQPDLFAGFHGVPKSIAIPSGKTAGPRFIRKLTSQTTLRELRNWVLEASRATKAKSERFEGVLGLLDELAKYATEDSTVDKAVAARAAALKAA